MRTLKDGQPISISDLRLAMNLLKLLEKWDQNRLGELWQKSTDYSFQLSDKTLKWISHMWLDDQGLIMDPFLRVVRLSVEKAGNLLIINDPLAMEPTIELRDGSLASAPLTEDIWHDITCLYAWYPQSIVALRQKYNHPNAVIDEDESVFLDKTGLLDRRGEIIPAYNRIILLSLPDAHGDIRLVDPRMHPPANPETSA